MAQFRLCLPAVVATIIVAMVLLVKRYSSRHPAGPWLALGLSVSFKSFFVFLCG